jgi:hypothetical protein
MLDDNIHFSANTQPKPIPTHGGTPYTKNLFNPLERVKSTEKIITKFNL